MHKNFYQRQLILQKENFMIEDIIMNVVLNYIDKYWVKNILKTHIY